MRDPREVVCEQRGVGEAEKNLGAAAGVVQGEIDFARRDRRARLIRQRLRRARFVNLDRRHLMPGGAQARFQRRLPVAPCEIEKMRGRPVAREKQRQDRLRVSGDDLGAPAARLGGLRGFRADGVKGERHEFFRATGELHAPRTRGENRVIGARGDFRPCRDDLEHGRDRRFYV